jgi:hypothetical protein
LKWRWNTFQTSGLKKAEDYLNHLRNQPQPLPTDLKARSIAEKIISAFSSTPYPGDNNFCGSRMGEEPAEYTIMFRGCHWQTLDTFFLSRNHSALSFFTDAGFHYFLPAYMLAQLRDEADDICFRLYYGLTDNTDLDEDSLKLFSTFTKQERAAVYDFLCHVKSEYDAEDIEKAIKNYWGV